MKIAWVLFGLLLLGSEVIGDQVPARGAGLAAQTQTFTGSLQGLVTSHTASVGGDTVSVAITQPGMPPIMTFRIDLNTIFFVVPSEGNPTKMAYNDVLAGELKRFAWYADSPRLPGKSVKVALEKGLATEILMYAACTRERCESPACKAKCKATKCACPKE